MKKIVKITGIVLLSLVGLLLILFLIARFAFRDSVLDLLYDMERNERAALLRDGGPYASVADAYFRFSYMQDSVRAREIRAYFRLDTLLRDEAPTWDNALALATFVARSIPHANQTILPEQRNAIGLWEYHLEVEPAFNCRYYSVMLHELLLASGIINRFVTCLPVDSLDRDCHVVNVVWLPEKQKWAMIDSDMKAYITSPDGDILSLEEMRERTIADQPMVVNSIVGSLNHNQYLSYLAKNLYWFECWEETGYDREMNGEGRAVVLLPSGFDGFKLAGTEVKTSNAAFFWAAPDMNRTN